MGASETERVGVDIETVAGCGRKAVDVPRGMLSFALIPREALVKKPS